MRRFGWARTARMAAVTFVAVSLALGATQASQAADKRELTVMTQNLYLGSSLEPALQATTPEQLVGAVATIYGTMLFTNFPSRASAVADEIAAERPDLIGLQEVSHLDRHANARRADPTEP